MGISKAAFVGIASFVVLGSSMMVPAYAGRGQSVVGTGTAVGIASDLSKGATPNIGGIKKRVDAVAQAGNNRTKETNELMQDDGLGTPAAPHANAKIMSESEFAMAVLTYGKEANTKLLGQRVQAYGVIAQVEHKDNFTYVYLLPAKGSEKDTPPFIFRMAGDKNYEVGTKGTFEGVFSFQGSDPSSGLPFLYFDSNVTNPQYGSPAPEQPAAPEVPFAGWRFLGSVQDGTGSTGVFQRDGETVYAQEGSELDGGIKVKSLKAGEAVLKDHHGTQTIIPW